jgi:hypothetical protein
MTDRDAMITLLVTLWMDGGYIPSPEQWAQVRDDSLVGLAMAATDMYQEIRRHNDEMAREHELVEQQARIGRRALGLYLLDGD